MVYFSTTARFTALRAAHAAAYAHHSKMEEEHGDHSPEESAASDAEYAALDAMLLEPAQVPGEVAEKLRFMLDRDIIDNNWGEKGEAFLATIQDDLLQLAHPRAGVGMAEAFAEWAAALKKFNDCDELENEDAYHAAARDFAEASRTVLRTPCRQPGDHLVKNYVNLYTTEGGIPDAFPFMIRHDKLDDDATLDNIGAYHAIQDLKETDIGQCMMALGRVDFDAATWVWAATCVGMHVSVTFQPDGSRQFGWGTDCKSEDPAKIARCGMLQRLIGGPLHAKRMTAVADEIEANWPGLVWNRPAPQAEAAA